MGKPQSRETSKSLAWAVVIGATLITALVLILDYMADSFGNTSKVALGLLGLVYPSVIGLYASRAKASDMHKEKMAELKPISPDPKAIADAVTQVLGGSP